MADMMGKRPTRTKAFRTTLIAPCGMNCRLCRAYTRDRNACPGCLSDEADKPETRVVCHIKTCDRIAKGGARYCLGCRSFPCDRLNHLDNRYRTKYGMSMIDNLKSIKQSGVRRFIESEKQKWTCPECGEIICVHKPQCLSCGYKWH
jgi:hypothetical protein